MPTPMPNFQRMNIPAAGTIHTALTADHRRILRCTLRDLFFVIAHQNDRDEALADAAAQADRTRTYTILLNDSHLRALRGGSMWIRKLNLPVLDARDQHRPVDHIKVTSARSLPMRTEHGRFRAALATADQLRKGHLFTVGEYTIDGAGRNHGLTLYRALADYDPATGTVERHTVTRYWDIIGPLSRADLTGRTGCGPDHLVYLIDSHAAVLDKLGLADITEHAPA